MTGRAIYVDSLITALSDPRVVEAFSKALQPFIGVTIVKSLHEVKNIVAKLSADLRDRDQRITRIKKENDDLKEIVQINSRHLNIIEAYSRIENLVTNGLPENFPRKWSNLQRHKTEMTWRTPLNPNRCSWMFVRICFTPT